MVLALVSDLIFDSKLSSTAEALGVPLQTTRSHKAILEKLQTARMVIIDLNAGENAVDLVGAVKSARREVPVVCFLSHVQVELATAARQAGADEVLPRSRFTAELDTILRRALSAG